MLIFIALALYLSSAVQSNIVSFLNSMKSGFLNVVRSVENFSDEHFDQREEIKILRKKNEEYKELTLVDLQLKEQLSMLLSQYNSKMSINPKVKLVSAISYAKFGDINKVWIDFDEFNSSKTYGLVYNNYAAGIVVSKDEHPLALLNRDLKSSYAVHVGQKNAPGIVHGNGSENLIVEFIPAWMSIEVGDEVKTSGLDNMFFSGIKVGKVIEIKRSQGYQNAIIKPYYSNNKIGYFYIIKDTKWWKNYFLQS